jgi:hypothetical protein
MLALLKATTPHGGAGVVPASLVNRYIEDEQKDLIREEWDKIVWQLSERYWKLDRLIGAPSKPA